MLNAEVLFERQPLIKKTDMKKILLAMIGFGFAASAYSQEAADKKIQAGVVAGFGMNFNKPGTKVIERKGVGKDVTIGANLNWNFTPTVGLNLGLEFDFESFKYASTTDSLTYRYEDTKILQKEDPSSATESVFLLSERKQRATYLSIPTMILFRTKYIGYFRYFGKFGARTSILLSNSIDDKGKTLVGDVNVTKNSGMKAAGDMFFLKSTVGLAGGAEWNFSGTTCLVAELGFYYGFTPLHNGEALAGSDKQRNMTLYNESKNSYTTLSAKQSQLMLKVSILF